MSATVRVRADVWALSAEDTWHPTILAYARAVAAMRLRPRDDPTSWAWRADWSSTAFGLRQAALSVASCGALMLAVVAPVAAPTHFALATAATAFVWWRVLGGRHAIPGAQSRPEGSWALRTSRCVICTPGPVPAAART